MRPFTRLRGLLNLRRREAEMTEEIRLHLEERTAEGLAAGLSAEEARLAALRQFGGVEQVKEIAREQRTGAMLELLARETRLALRSLRRSPLFTLAALLTLTLGLGVNTAMFGLVDALLLRPAPYPDADRLVRIYRTAPESATLPHSLPNYRDTRTAAGTFAALTAYQAWTYSLAAPGEPAEPLSGVTATADLFATLGMQPVLGRGFTAEEQRPGQDRVVVLSDDFWRRRYGADPQVIGRTLRLDGEPVTIVGVMPAQAAYPLFWGRVDVWRPLRLSEDWREQRTVRWLNIIGRLQPGTSLDQNQAELATVADRLAGQYPDANAGAGLRSVRLHASAMGDIGRRVTWLTFALAGVVLLISCANLASLQLARTLAATRQFAVRAALGASRATLVRQSLLESLLLALGGGILGLGVALAINRVIASQLSLGTGEVPLEIESRLFVFAALAAIAAGALFGAVPAWVVSRIGAGEALKQQSRGTTAGRGQHRLRHALLVMEIALTLVLLGTAALFLDGLRDFARRDLGWRSSGLLMGTLNLPEPRYNREQLRTFHERLLDRLQQLPGVERASLASAAPLIAASNPAHPLYLEGRPAPRPGSEPFATFTVVGPRYFETMGLRLLRGRWFPDDIRPDARPVVVIGETLARTYWPGEDAVGKRLSRKPDGAWSEVIGVVSDAEYAADLGGPDTRLQVYESLVVDPWAYVTVVVRGANPQALIQPVRRAVAELDADLPVNGLRTVEDTVASEQHFYRLADHVLAGFAALGLLLSAIGIYGVISGLVIRRTSEFGIRLALGARAGDILWPILWSGLRLALAGVALGIVGAVAAGGVLATVAPALPLHDMWAVAAASALLLLVTAAACAVPAYRATKVDPLTALRCE